MILFIKAKRAYIDQHKLTIWRFHDHMHLHEPDLIIEGMLKRLEWKPYQDASRDLVFHFPKRTVRELTEELKMKLGFSDARLVGNPEAVVSRIGMNVGAVGGDFQLQFLRDNEDVEVLICGETVEWQVCEYVRDAALAGRNLALIIIGHFYSEDVGMAYFADLLQERLPGISVQHVRSGDSVRSI